MIFIAIDLLKCGAGTNEQATEIVHAFFETPYFENILPVDGALNVLKEYKKSFRFICVTSRQHAIVEQTEEWLRKHYPGIFEDVLFGNHWTKDAPDPDIDTPSKRSKAEMCSSISAIALIDDSLSYAQECSKSLGPSGFKVFAFW